jgi:beta-lactamase class D
MRTTVILFLMAATLQACHFNIKENPEFSTYFDEAGVVGSIVLYDLKKDQFILNDPERSMTPTHPASTFKIFHSLVALETGAIKGPDEWIAWDSVSRDVNSWNQDHTMRMAVQNSTVWFFEELCTRIGRDSMEKYLRLGHYGNERIGPRLERYWLEGDLRISQIEQIEFLKRLYEGKLPFSDQTLNTVKEILIQEEKPNYIIRGKTGWSLRDSLGWYVGYVERADNVCFFANRIEMHKKNGRYPIPERIDITMRVLNDEGWLRP